MFAIISDIHSNLEALEAVLADIRRRNVQRIVCLGDVVGYGPNPHECLRLIRKNCEWMLKGNHDVAVLIEPLGFNKVARDAAIWTQKQIAPHWYSGRETHRNWSMLDDAPETVREGDMLFVHGSPRDPIMEYVEESDCMDMGFGPGEKIKEIIGMIDHLCFVGHTHRPGVIDEECHFKLPADMNQVWPISTSRALINVGSVGQPRDGCPHARYVIVTDTEVRYHAVEYDMNTTAKKIRAIPELDNRLANRLIDGL